ncbi:hypothetical protein G6F22_014409 [Rhizopus arrhizus]|nr:hypothetical protein G6F22_014409 [Rhizopus arrhizus]
MQAGQQQRKHAAGGDQRGGAQVGLHQDQYRGNSDQHRGGQHRAWRRWQRLPVQVPGHHQRQAELEQLGRLQVEHTQVEPALPVLAGTDHVHRHQRQHRQRIQRRCPRAQAQQRNPRQQPHCQQATGKARGLPGHRAGHAVQHRQAGAHQDQQRNQQRQVDRAHCLTAAAKQSFPFHAESSRARLPFMQQQKQSSKLDSTKAAEPGSAVAAVYRVVAAHCHHQPEAGQQRYRRGAAVADQWHRHAHHRQQAGNHSTVHQDIDEERQPQAAGQQPCVRVACVHRDPQAAPDHEQVKRKHRRHADPAELFGQH